ncbi:hypothetical protein Angca_001499, partial [Angiostrongylus cantonensis]
DLVDVVCDRNPSRPYCIRSVLRRKEEDSPDDPFKEKFLPINTEVRRRLYYGEKHNFIYFQEEESELEESTEFEEETTKRSFRSTTPIPLPRQNLLFTVFPTLQKEKDWRRYCPVNQYTFQTTCLPGKKLRYDLQVFCQEFADMCGVPNINLYPSRHGDPTDEGRPKGYGQKQKNGQLGLGKSFGFGLGAIPVFGKLGGNRSNKRVRGYEPGYGALNPNAPVAIGKVDHDAINLPGGFGEVEIEKGGGFGVGK